MAVFNEVINVTLEDAKLSNEALEIEEGYYEEEEHDAVIKMWTARFSDGCEADIKLCNGDTPYIDSVLFDQNGYQLNVLEISDELFGEYVFEANGNQYIVTVKVPEEEWKRTMTEDEMEQYLIQKGYDLGQNEPPEFIVDSTKTFDYSINEGFDWILDQNERYLFFSKKE